MNRLARLLQLLNVKRTIRLEQQAEQLDVLSRSLVASSGKLVVATEDLVANLLALPISGQRAIDTAVAMAARGSIQSNLATVQQLMASGQIREAKLVVDALVLVTKAEAS